MKCFFSLCAVWAFLAWHSHALGMAPYEMARNGQLEDLKLWVSLQGDNVDVADSRWDSFARTAAERESDLDLAWRFDSDPGIKHLLEQGVSL